MLSIRTKTVGIVSVVTLAVSLAWGYPLLHRSLVAMDQARESANRGGYEIGEFNWLSFWAYGLPFAQRIVFMIGVLALLCTVLSAMLDRLRKARLTRS